MKRLLAMMAVCLQAGVAMDLPKPAGTYPVGRTQMEWKVAPDRKLVAWVWYPAAEASRQEAVLPEAWTARRLETLTRRLGRNAAGAMSQARAWHKTGAAPAASPARFPVLIFSPGLSWLPVDYSVLTIGMASRGYVVVGVVSPGFAGPVMYADGSVSGQTLGPGDQSVWEKDLRFAIEQVRALDARHDSRFHRRLDLSRLGLFGHSMGGAAGMVVAQDNPAVHAAANLDGDFMGAARDARPAQPLLLLSHAAEIRPDQPWLVREGLERSERRRTGDWKSVASRSKAASRVMMQGAMHLDLLDAAHLSAESIPANLRANRFGALPADTVHEATVSLLDAFFRQAPLAPAVARHRVLRFAE